MGEPRARSRLRRLLLSSSSIAASIGLLFPALVGALPAWMAPPAAIAAARDVRLGARPPALLPPSRLPATAVLLTPPMGWNGFNHFYTTVTSATVEAQARVLVSSGMKAAGYIYVNLDGGWDLKQRDAQGNLMPNPAKFPQGIKTVADYVHSLGLKFGIYTSAGLENCARSSAGSFGHYWQDASTFAGWGVDYLKLDWCVVPYKLYPGLSHAQVDKLLATQMADALTATGRPIVYDLNGPGWEMASRLANLWRTTQDSRDQYVSLLANFVSNVNHYRAAGPNGWNDPDMLEVGNGGMSVVEYRSQFSLWAEMAAPLIAGNDLTRMTPETRAILTNAAVIAVDQDPMGRQGYAVASSGGHWVLTKPLADGSVAVVLFNQTADAATITTTVSQVGLHPASEYMLVDLWSGYVGFTTSELSATVPAHGVVMYRISAGFPGPLRA